MENTVARERDEAQAACHAWQEVYETLEAHLMDRVEMNDKASPETYLNILRSSVARVERSSQQIVAARRATEARLQAKIDALQEKIEMDDLCSFY